MFQKLIDSGRHLVARLERYRYTSISDIPPEERMTSKEISGWLSAAKSLIIEAFGENSASIQKWNNLHAKLDEQADNELRDDTWNEARSAISRIHESMGLLAEFQYILVSKDDSQKKDVKFNDKSQDKERESIERADQLYEKVVSLSKDLDNKDHATVKLIVEYANDAISAYGSTNQEKKVYLREIIKRANEIIPPGSFKDIVATVEATAIRLIFPKGRKKRIAFFVGVSLVISIGIIFALRKQLSEQFDLTKSNPPEESIKPNQNSTPSSTPQPDNDSPKEKNLSNIPNRGRWRPIRPGLSIGGVNTTAGTTGLLLKDEHGRRYILGSAPLYGNPEDIGKVVLQPGPFDGGSPPEDAIGTYAKNLPLENGSSIANMTGLVKLDNGIEFDQDIPGIGSIRGFHEASPGLLVKKFGRTTGLTSGTVIQTNKSITIISPYAKDRGKQIQINDVIWCTDFSEGGDSGAIVVDEDGYAIGIIVAGGPDGTYVAPIQKILNAFNNAFGLKLSLATV